VAELSWVWKLLILLRKIPELGFPLVDELPEGQAELARVWLKISGRQQGMTAHAARCLKRSPIIGLVVWDVEFTEEFRCWPNSVAHSDFRTVQR